MNADELWEVLVAALDVHPDGELIERPDWVQLRTPSSRHASHNKVLRAVLDVADADRRIAEVLEEHRSRGAGIEWIVDARSAPDDLSARIRRAGLAVLGEMVGMFADTAAIAVDDPPPGVTIELARIGDEHAVGRVSRIGWNMSAEREGLLVSRVAEATQQAATCKVRFWVARLAGEVVGWASLRGLPSVGYLQGGCVLPDARDQGIYRALTRARIADLAQQGVDRAAVWSDPTTSGPVLIRLGFREVTRAIYHSSTR